MICDHCKNDPGFKRNGHWKGFKDGDTGELVCLGCKAIHYRAKAKKLNLSTGMLYSELPVNRHMETFKSHIK